jgi:hypothetical protein
VWPYVRGCVWPSVCGRVWGCVWRGQCGPRECVRLGLGLLWCAVAVGCVLWPPVCGCVCEAVSMAAGL